ncbi:uncharacterized protein LOC128191367 [Crassostrea angulata]|uniref:uncharacterized protein LOC128191367 n=1 Tax=Magallana angulata TaxID=2784310 RepID=UPI0022B19542|nr:uncharacterized protein LOC128191367 [Crassostrea angulata]
MVTEVEGNILFSASWPQVFHLSTHFVSANISSHCNLDDVTIPTAIETIIFFLSGYIEYVAQNCPTPFLGSFNYTFNDGSQTYCDGTSVWDVCSDQTQMVVNHTLCSTKQFYSNGGVAYCAYSTSVGSTYYVTVVNADSTVYFTTTFRFTCYAVKSSGGFVYASDNKGACVLEQDPQTKLSTGSGTLILSVYASKSVSSRKSSNGYMYIGIVIGAIAGALVLAVAVLVFGTLLYRKYTARIFPHEHTDG